MSAFPLELLRVHEEVLQTAAGEGVRDRRGMFHQQEQVGDAVLHPSFHELALGTTLSVPTLEGKVGVRVPKGTSDGRILRVRGRGVPKRSGGNGDLLVTVKVAVPPNLEGEAAEALEAYAKAERASGFDPRAGWAGSR